MFFQQAKLTAYRRYGEIVIVIGYISGELVMLNEPTASLWERLKSPLSLVEAVHFLSKRLGFPVNSQLVERALLLQTEKGILISGETRRYLQKEYHKIVRDRGTNTDKLFSIFLSMSKPYLSPAQLLRVDLETNNVCNLRCVHCYMNDYRDTGVMTLEDICCLFDKLEKMGVLFLSLTGGEIALRKDFLDIVRFAQEHHFVVTILSNATRFDDHQIEQLKIISPANVFVSLYGITAKVHEKVTNQPGTYSLTIKTVRRLREAGVPVVLRYLIMKHNVCELENLPGFANALDCLFTTNYTIFTTSRSRQQILENRVSDEDLIWLFRNDLVDPPKRLQCIAGTHKLRISATGDVFPCELLRLKFGNLHESRIEEIINSVENARHMDVIQTAPALCSKCSRNTFCPRCPGLAFHEDGFLSSISTEACRVTELYKIAVSKSTVNQKRGKGQYLATK